MSAPIDPSTVKYVEIFPPIGISRLGNSPDSDGYFIGPEIPHKSDIPSGGFKDASGNIKRQAARFRAYAFDAQGQVLGELNNKTGYALNWTVNVANSKAANYRFHGKYKKPTGLRNPSVQGALPVDQRTDLIVSASQTVDGVNQISGPLMGSFLGTNPQPAQVYLGELHTDEQGRLLFLGGRGRSYPPGDDTTPPPMVTSEFDMSNWVDDTCDGMVNVVATYSASGQAAPAPSNPAWVICAPPKFSWGARAPTSLYDLIEEVYEGPKRADPGYQVPNPVFYEDAWPLFESTFTLSWLNQFAHDGHGPSGVYNFLPKEAQLANPGRPSNSVRQKVFGYIRAPVISNDPNSDNYKERQQQATSSYMPRLSGDTGDMPEGGQTTTDPNRFASLTRLQYDRLKKWAEGKFTTGTKGTPPAEFDQIPLAEQPKALTKAALEWCIGAPLFPGLEMYWIAESPTLYNLTAEFAPSVPLDPPFRINSTSVKPGDLTQGLSLPWQSDFYLCNTHWWPSNRPDNIITPDMYAAVHKATPDPTKLAAAVAAEPTPWPEWARGLREDPDSNEEGIPYPGSYDMVVNWHNLAFVAKVDYGDPSLNPILVEGTRGTIINPNPPN